MSWEGASVNVCQQLEEQGYAVLAAEQVDQPSELLPARQELLDSFEHLCQDRFMGDGGAYRWRRFGRFFLEQGRLRWHEDTTLYQPREHNPLNGGIVREFAPLLPSIRENPFLHHLIHFDHAQLRLPQRRWQVGVHQVRIVARSDEPGQPTPEGIHLDGEAYTVQHLIRRENVAGGVFRAYDEARNLRYEWLQDTILDSLYFTNRLWHDATPVACEDPSRPGYREILLIDFDPA